MRAAPTYTEESAAGDFQVYARASSVAVTATSSGGTFANVGWLMFDVASGLTAGDGVLLVDDGNANAQVSYSAEL